MFFEKAGIEDRPHQSVRVSIHTKNFYLNAMLRNGLIVSATLHPYMDGYISSDTQK